MEFVRGISARIGIGERDMDFAFDREFGNRMVVGGWRGIEMIGDGYGNRNRDRGWGRVHRGLWLWLEQGRWCGECGLGVAHNFWF